MDIFIYLPLTVCYLVFVLKIFWKYCGYGFIQYNYVFLFQSFGLKCTKFWWPPRREHVRTAECWASEYREGLMIIMQARHATSSTYEAKFYKWLSILVDKNVGQTDNVAQTLFWFQSYMVLITDRSQLEVIIPAVCMRLVYLI